MTEPATEQVSETANLENTSEGNAAATEEVTTNDTAQADVSVITDDVEPEQDNAGDSAADAAADEADTQEGAPESYEAFQTPDGVDSLDDDVLTTFSESAKELNLSQDKAQSLINSVAPKIQAQQKAALETAQQNWANEVASDPEIGGDKLSETMSLARKAYRSGASPKLQALLKESGLDVHPEMVRMFRYFGGRQSEDKVVEGGDAPVKTAKGDAFSDTPGNAKKLYKKHLS